MFVKNRYIGLIYCFNKGFSVHLVTSILNNILSSDAICSFTSCEPWTPEDIILAGSGRKWMYPTEKHNAGLRQKSV
jgi:hypothetical protein